MKKILLILLVCVSFSSASTQINEYMSDVYFANGIDTDEDDAQKNFNFRSDFLGKNYE